MFYVRRPRPTDYGVLVPTKTAPEPLRSEVVGPRDIASGQAEPWIPGRYLLLFLAGLVGALSGILVGTTLSILASGLFMFITGWFGHLTARRKATWTAFEIAGLGIALLAFASWSLDLLT